MIELRPYQHGLIEECRGAYRSGKRRVCLQSPTGSGKGCMLSFMAKNASEKGQRVGILAHRSEIVNQISATLDSVEVPHGIIRSGFKMDRSKRVQVASVQTLVNRFDQIEPFDFIIGDEIHHSVSNTWNSVFARYNSARWLGCTATPERLDGRGLGELFDHLVIGPSVESLISQGFLARPRYFCPPNSPDLSNVSIQMGEYSKRDSEEVMDKPSVTGCCVAHYKQHLNGKTAIAFCISIEHCEHVAESFRACGIQSAVIDGKLSDEDRKQRLQSLASGEIQVLCSCEILGEGVDVPSVGGCILLRPTASLALHLQQIGRCLRPKKGDNSCVILDHVGNVMRHGPAEKHREWSLDSRKRTSKQENDPQNKTCRECFCIFQGPRCPECGQAPVGKPREIEVVEGTLEEVDVAALLEKREKRIEVGRAKSLEELIQIGKDRKYSPQWAFIRWNISPHNPRNRKQMTLV